MTAGSGDDQPTPWAPFPVQDWSRMPAAGSELDPSPGWGPPTGSPTRPSHRPENRRTALRHRLLPPVTVALVLVLVAAGLGVAARAGAGGEAPSSDYLPADGAAWTSVVESTTPAGTDRTVAVVESARLGGVEATQTLGNQVGVQLLTALGIRDTRSPARVWRVTSTPVGLAGTDPTTRPDAQRSRFYRVDRGVELVLDSGPDGLTTFDPGLRELPAEPEPGDRWTSRGSAGAGRTYTASMSAAAAGTGCLQVTGTLTFAGSGDTAPHRLTRTWCRREGAVQLADRSSAAGQDVGSTERFAPRTALPQIPVTATGTDPWGDPARWRARTLPLRSVEGGADPGSLGVAVTQQSAAVTATGLLARPVVQGRDVIITTPRTEDLLLVRRLHPGGLPTMITALGSAVVVATTGRELVGYGTDGLRRWTLAVPDAITLPGLAVGGDLAVTTAAGTVIMVDPRTGRVRWRHDVGADPSAPPVTDGAQLLVADRSGTLTALAVADGTVRWTAQEPGVSRMTTADGLLVTDDASTLEGRSLADGRLRWRWPHADLVRSLVGLGGTVVAGTDRTTTGLGLDGTPRWTAPPLSTAVGDGTAVAGLSGDALLVITGDGRTVARVPVAPARADETRTLVRAGDGVIMTSSVFGAVQVIT
ncbi:outer membrane protein assembly factor BamB [Friedmanniella endophytica]|uniref:Outer membrane protein assembly factor BamB n=1 Tax=Microlunatus kandeliicorticis TaxID=1759536 RepID=A0A7W3IUW8_9ACTN|nr:PQQ-binding-like beta-propeller repeat protein [Microlunatus kandeliicorticis]MBA8795639.1 outer membrane protein assembly factor BamB [Microlunatus kandeliicorticis]